MEKYEDFRESSLAVRAAVLCHPTLQLEWQPSSQGSVAGLSAAAPATAHFP